MYSLKEIWEKRGKEPVEVECYGFSDIWVLIGVYKNKAYTVCQRFEDDVEIYKADKKDWRPYDEGVR